MITFPALPAWAWKAIAAVVLVGLAVWWHQHHAAAVIHQAIEAERATLRAAARTELLEAAVEAHNTRTRADEANLEMIYAIRTERDAARAATSRAAGQLGGLRSDLAALRRGESPSSSSTGPRSLADVGGALADGLEQCGVRYSEVEAIARDLAIQVTGLQRYVRTVVGPVCIEGIAPAQDRARIDDQGRIEGVGAAQPSEASSARSSERHLDHFEGAAGLEAPSVLAGAGDQNDGVGWARP